MIERFQSFVTGITICYKYIQRIKNAEMTEFGLKGTHVMCVFFLHHNPEGLTAAELCQLCAEDKAAISRTLSTLQEKSYIQSGEKKYRAKITLTEEGLLLAKQVDAVIEQWVGVGGDGLSEDEREKFHCALELISANLKGKLGTKK